MPVSVPQRRESACIDTELPPPVHQQVAGSTLRVLHVINGEHYAGAERVQDLLAARLPHYGVQPGFVCLKPGSFAGLRQAKEVPLFELPMRARFDLRPAVQLARLVRKEGYDVLHTHSARALMIASLASRRCAIPIVHHVHGNTASEVAGRRFSRLNAWVERKAVSKVTAVIAVSRSVADYIQTKDIGNARVHIVPNGVPVRAELRRHSISLERRTIGFVALLRPRKGLECLLEAASAARARHPSLRVRIVGRFETVEYEREIRERSERLGVDDLVEWCGFRQCVGSELDEMDILAFPSILPEGMPMVLLEAMAAGVPIVASRVNGVVDLLRDGEDSLLVPPENPAELAGALDALFCDDLLRERLRTTAYRRQRELFSDDAMAAAVASIYREMVLAYA